MKSDPLIELEAELAGLKPCAPSDTLKSRIGNQLRPSAQTSRVIRKTDREQGSHWFAWGWALAGVLVIALVTTLWPVIGNKNATVATKDRPSSRIIHYQLLSERDDGVVLNENGQPVRQVRYSADETVRWRSPRTGASIQMSYPREETMLVPVSGN